MMSTPPPLPPSGIECIRFEGTGAGIHTAGFDRKRLDMAQLAAKQWLNANPHIEIFSIESCFGNIAAFVTVWYRRQSN
jgi:hypothetical protein